MRSKCTVFIAVLAALFAITVEADTSAKLIKKVAPVYPQRALSRGIEGNVRVQFDIDVVGNVVSPRVIESDSPALNREALKAVSQYHFEPAMQNNTPVVEKDRSIQVRFTIDNCPDSGVNIDLNERIQRFLIDTDTFNCARERINIIIDGLSLADRPSEAVGISAPNTPVPLTYVTETVVKSNQGIVTGRFSTTTRIARDERRGFVKDNQSVTSVDTGSGWTTIESFAKEANTDLLSLVAGRFTSSATVTEDQWVNGTQIEGGEIWDDRKIAESKGNPRGFPKTLGESDLYYERLTYDLEPEEWGTLQEQRYSNCVPVERTSIAIGDRDYPVVRMICASAQEIEMRLGEIETSLMRWLFMQWVSTDLGIVLKSEGTASAVLANQSTSSSYSEVASISAPW